MKKEELFLVSVSLWFSWKGFLKKEQIRTKDKYEQHDNTIDINSRYRHTSKIGIKCQKWHHRNRECKAQSYTLKYINFCLAKKSLRQKVSWKKKNKYWPRPNAKWLHPQTLLIRKKDTKKCSERYKKRHSEEKRVIGIIPGRGLHRQ